MCSETTDLRLFFGLFPPQAVRRALVARQRSLGLAARAVAPERLHITLVFLGNTAPGRVADVQAAAGRIAFPGAELTLDRAGSFRRSRVAWLGPSATADALRQFQGALGEALRQAGCRVERRRWEPHVTLYRDLRKPFGTMPVEPVVWTVREYRLTESRLGPEGPDYREIARWAASTTAGRRNGASENPSRGGRSV